MLCGFGFFSDRKTRSLGVLLQAFPFLLHRLDALQDRFAAAVESNDILKSALEQMQEPAVATSKLAIDSEGHVAFSSAGMSGSMYMQLAREKYLLAAPYPLELLADLTGAQAFNDHLEVKSVAVKKKFAPFRIATKVAKLRDNQHEEELPGDQSQQLVVLSADPNDASGASYLNRSKINAFLEVIQSRAARSKFKSLVVGKLADCLNKLRELAHRSASEAAVQRASIQMLQSEVLELRQKLKRQPSTVDSNSHDSAVMTARSSADDHKRRQFLLKIVDIYVEKQQRDDLRQSTFLTQPLSSDMLITKTQGSLDHMSESSDDRLCLTESELDDEDVEQLLLKILVSGVRFREIWLDANNLTDLGAQYTADFLEKCSSSIRILSLTGNKRITRHGIEMIRRGLVRNHRVQQVEELRDDSKRAVTLHGFAVQPEFDVSGNTTEVIHGSFDLRSDDYLPRVDHTHITLY
ncbi:hypothetical protein BBJ28_00011929 [Nothophytophthora sp. Chile5]|nr:hypothetical protein BBJ28_00011929 [Nothophytophthora sp. Chile5]